MKSNKSILPAERQETLPLSVAAKAQAGFAHIKFLCVYTYTFIAGCLSSIPAIEKKERKTLWEGWEISFTVWVEGF